MSWIDLLIVGVIAWFTFRAFANGLIREVVTLGALILGVVLAGLFYAELAADIEFLIDDGTVRKLVSFMAILGGVVVLGQVLAAVLRRVASMLMLGPFDRLGGAAFGFAKGFILVQVLLIAVAIFPASTSVAFAVDDAALTPFFLDSMPLVELTLPSEFHDALGTLGRWRENLPQELPSALTDAVSGDAQAEPESP